MFTKITESLHQFQHGSQVFKIQCESPNGRKWRVTKTGSRGFILEADTLEKAKSQLEVYCRTAPKQTLNDLAIMRGNLETSLQLVAANIFSCLQMLDADILDCRKKTIERLKESKEVLSQLLK